MLNGPVVGVLFGIAFLASCVIDSTTQVPLAFCITAGGFVWWLSHRLTKLEDGVSQLQRDVEDLKQALRQRR